MAAQTTCRVATHSSRYMYSSNFHTGCPNQVLGSKRETEAEDLNREVIKEKEKEKWVINISNTTLTADQEKLLAHGPNYAVVPWELPVAPVHSCCRKCLHKVGGRQGGRI